MNRPNLVFDFDGVIHSYTSGWQGVTEIPDPPVEGINECLLDLKRDFKIHVLSTRCVYDGGIEAVKKYLDDNNIYYDAVIKDKVPAIAYIDDRGITFDGNKVKELPNIIRNFRPWNKKG